MKNAIITTRVGRRLEGFVPPIPQSTQIDLFVRLLDIIIKTGRYFPIISISLTGLNLYLAVNDFLANNIGFAILNSMFVICGLFFLIQMRQRGNDYGLKSIELDAMK